jgi:CheY-like chemotaxis protein
MALQKFHNPIILADDDEDDREIFRMALQELQINAEVVYAENGEALLHRLKSSTPGIIFLDLNMPLVNGFECLRFIRSSSKFNSIPVVILSTSSSNIDINKCYELGSTYYIVKPFSYLQLANIIEQLFSKNLEPGYKPGRKDFLIKSQSA